jgi:Rad52/22 family double-strand break repair protein
MSRPNGHISGSVPGEPRPQPPGPNDAMFGQSAQFSPEQVRRFVELLEVPFEPSVIEWRVTNTSKSNGRLRGQVIPYADQRAYTDRLNALFTPAGWTRRYTVHTSAYFQQGEDQKSTAKVFVTCDLTIFGLGSHSATGEDFVHGSNACTAAEAQAFKRSCSCFGLGRYLYHFTGIWVDLDERKRPKTKPTLTGWATPEGWKQGLRPGKEPGPSKPNDTLVRQDGTVGELVRQIEAMAQPLGKGLYRGLLKSVARVWNPTDVKDRNLLERLLAQMQAAERGLSRLETAYLHTGAEPLAEILHSIGIRDMNQVSSLELLEKIVVALEAEAKGRSHGN